MTGVTCVGVRGCVDYDCAPNLCHEKDLAFLEIMGALLPHASGPGYAKFLAMQKLVLPRDSWKEAFRVQEQRDLNLRTNYDNYARGMANLAFALNHGSDPKVAVYERLAVVRDPRITRQRDIVASNGTMENRTTLVAARFLEAGRYRVEIDARPAAMHSAEDLAKGITLEVPPNSMRRIRIAAVQLDTPSIATREYDTSTTWLSDIPEMASQRGIGLPSPVFQKDRSFRGGRISLGGRTYEKGLGLAANTVVVYRLGRRYRSFGATFGVDAEPVSDGPRSSVYLTVLVDGKCKFTSGPMHPETDTKSFELDVRNADVLVLRMSGNWDDGGNLANDMGSLGDARLTGKAQ
jgi:hypothetical protein